MHKFKTISELPVEIEFEWEPAEPATGSRESLSIHSVQVGGFYLDLNTRHDDVEAMDYFIEWEMECWGEVRRMQECEKVVGDAND